jgi:hypothetical protein
MQTGAQNARRDDRTSVNVNSADGDQLTGQFAYQTQ